MEETPDSLHFASVAAEMAMDRSGPSHARPFHAPGQGQDGSQVRPPILRTRHSSSVLSPDRPNLSSPPAGPTSDPFQPGRSSRSTLGSSSNMPSTTRPPRRPSTADNAKSREDVTPWEFQSVGETSYLQQQQPQRLAPSVRSRASSAALGLSLATGPVEEVTPWEVHPFVEEHGHGILGEPSSRSRANTTASNSNSSTHSGGGGIGYGVSIEKDFGPDKTLPTALSANAKSVRSRASSAALGAVGSVEEVTPWEVQELLLEVDEDEMQSPVRSPAPSQSKSRTGASSLRSRASSAAMRGTGTGPAAEVTPWEVQDLLLEEDGEDGEDVEDALDLEAKSMDDKASVLSGGSKKSARSSFGRLSRSGRRSGEMDRKSGAAVTTATTDKRKSGFSGAGKKAGIRASVDFGISGGIGYGVSVEKDFGPTLNGRARSTKDMEPGTSSEDQGPLGPVEEVTPWELYPPPPPPHPASERAQGREMENTVKPKAKSKSIFMASKAKLALKDSSGEKEKNSEKRLVKVSSRVSRGSIASSGGLSSSSLQVNGNQTDFNVPAAGTSTSTLGSYSHSNHNVSYHHQHPEMGSNHHLATSPVPRLSATGPLEEVMPWELHSDLPPPVPPLPSFATTALSPSSSLMSTPVPSPAQLHRRSQAPPVHSLLSRPLPTGPIEEVTPWEIEIAPDEDAEVEVVRKSIEEHSRLQQQQQRDDEFDADDEAQYEARGQVQNQCYFEETEGQELEIYPLSPSTSSAATATFSSSARASSSSIHNRYYPSHAQTPTPTQMRTPLTAASIAHSISTTTTDTNSSITSGSTSTTSAGTGTGTADSSIAPGRPRGSMTLEQLEEVTPWELIDAPVASADTHSEAKGDASTEATSSGEAAFGEKARRTADPYQASAPAPGPIRQSSSTGVGSSSAKAKVLVDFGLRRRRSTGASGSAIANQSSRKPTAKPTGNERDRPRMSASNSASSPLGTNPPQSNEDDPRFSTADRTILEQLKANIEAREAQFQLKGVGHTVLGGGRGPGKKHHPFSREEVPYPRSYGREIVDLDVWETMFALDIVNSLTWHAFEKPPAKVLELGCGTGTWILQCASTWKECHFVGLDIVPLHPNLQNLGSSDLASRIVWTQHNFLDGLPYQDEEFDFVHIKRIALGVPEDKWDKLFEEISRVMKPGGAFEMVEEDLFFPGKQTEDDEDSVMPYMKEDDLSQTNLRPKPTRRRSLTTARDEDVNRDEPSNIPKIENDPPEAPKIMNHILPDSGHPKVNMDGDASLSALPHATPTQSTSQKLPSTPSPHPSPPRTTGFIPPHSRSSARPTLHVKTQPKEKSSESFTDLFGASSVSLLGSMAYAPSSNPTADLVKAQHQQAEEQNTAQRRWSPDLSPVATTSRKKAKVSPFLLRSLTKSPVNPRDHTILAAVWKGMLEARFVNMTPLSILTTYMEYHFRDVRTHPPLVYTFPPVPPKPSRDEKDDITNDNATPIAPSDSSEIDTDEARDALIPRPKKPQAPKPQTPLPSTSTQINSNGAAQGDQRWVSMSSLLKNKSPYVSLDESRGGVSYPPARRSTQPKKTGDDSSRSTLSLNGRTSRLPNPTVRIDLQTLNLHLSLRAKEIIACSESMWEWVEEYQADAKAKATRREYNVPAADDSASTSERSLTRNLILDMTREDFDILLNNFEMDMLDKAAVGHVLEERFGWKVFPSSVPLDDRKAFEKACLKYEEWVAGHHKSKTSLDTQRTSDDHLSRNSTSISSSGRVLPTSDPSVSHDHDQTAPLKPSIRAPSSDSTGPTPVSNSPPHRVNSKSNSHTASSSTIPPASTEAPPTEMLSRAVRVYVAWKAS